MDMISKISDDLLIQILSLIPTKDVMATSCLSKRWQLLWSKVATLEYDDSNMCDGNYIRSFTQFVYRSLLLNKAPVLQSLILKVGPKCEAVDFGIWIDTAVSRCLQELIIDKKDDIQIISLPCSLYTCETLNTLVLYNSIRLDIPCNVCLPCLKHLCLKDVDYAAGSSIPRLLSGCPNLEYLSLRQDKLDVILVLPPSLQTLKITNHQGGDEKCSNGLVTVCPSLQYFHFRNSIHYDLYQIEHMPQLEEAHVDMMMQGVNHNFLKPFTSARFLYLSLSFSEVLYSSGINFHRLVNLELSTCVLGWWDLLTHMLQDSPILEVLKLNDEHELGFPSEETPGCWTCPSSVPKCLLHSLEAFIWYGYKGRRGDKEISTYILTNASRLKDCRFISRIRKPLKT